MSQPYAVITSDAHAGASIQAYREYLDEKHKTLFDEWRGTYKNPQKKHIGSKKHKNWDDAERLGDMDAEGVAGEIIFPNTVPPFFKSSVLICGNPRPEDYALWLQGIRAHNRWLVDFCADHPERRAGIGLIYLNDLDDAMQDIQWIADHGLRGGILLPHVPDDCTHIQPLYAPEYERLWAMIQDLDLVVNQHGGTGSPDYGTWPISLPIRLIETAFYSTRSYAHLLLSGVFHRFPKLRYILTEAGCNWVPERLEMLDMFWSRIGSGAVGEFEFVREAMPPEPPSFYAKRNCWYGASSASPPELAGRHEIGIERICWGTDYPHYEGTYPNTRLAMRHCFHDKPEEEVRAILGGNAAELYGFDLEKLAPIVEQIGPRPEEIAAPLSEDEFPEKTHTNAFRR
ncbi:MAG: amidohydrolase [Deltaproteobacteria bacterium]|nr:amidohydrolase [Deltaproteobacteria bacterium]MBW2394265.1 amidohydrolase [Deltaproteobacteria bacterium]